MTAVYHSVKCCDLEGISLTKPLSSGSCDIDGWAMHDASPPGQEPPRPFGTGGSCTTPAPCRPIRLCRPPGQGNLHPPGSPTDCISSAICRGGSFRRPF